MKRLILFMLAFPMLAIMLLFVIRGPDGRPLLTKDTIKAPRIELHGFSKVKGLFEKKDPPVKKEPPAQNTTRMYKWRNADGVWCFSDKLNADGPYEVIHVKPRPRIVQTDDNEIDLDIGDQETDSLTQDSENMASVPPPKVAPVFQGPRLIEQAKELKNQVEERNREMDRLMETYVP
ncbi:MAG: hypothetical protein SV775_07745 [Thermodesulfobacteriota bacterium]|nr:hypothetical protein [Thermodesulfobacteriota bacterium]